MTVLTGLSFGLLPALQATKLDLCTALKASAGTTGSRRSVTLRKALVVAQVAVSFLLLVAAGLFARTLFNLKDIDTGLKNIEHLVTFQLDPSKSDYKVPQVHQFYRDVLAQIQATPGVTAAAYSWMPLLQGWAPTWHMRIEGHIAQDGEDTEGASNIVSPGYWQAMRLADRRA